MLKKFVRIAFALFLGLQIPARALDLPSGLSIEPPADMDLTFQLVPAYDDNEKVIARWRGDDLQYFVSVNRLPAGYLDAKSYLSGFERDLRSAWSTLVVGRKSTYKAKDGLSGTVVEYSKPAKGEAPGVTLIVHFIADGKASFIATASPVAQGAAGAAFDETVRLFKSAAFSKPGADSGPVMRDEDELVGKWTSEDSLPDGRKISSTLELKRDLSFATTVSMQGTAIFSATGVWSKSAEGLHWTYLYSSPALPADKREDDDQIVSLTESALTLKSALSGRERVFKRVE